MKKEKKRKKRLALDWSLLASALIFFLLGKYIAPEYERQFLEGGLIDEAAPVSGHLLLVSKVLLGLFVLLWVFRFLRKKTG